VDLTVNESEFGGDIVPAEPSEKIKQLVRVLAAILEPTAHTLSHNVSVEATPQLTEEKVHEFVDPLLADATKHARDDWIFDPRLLHIIVHVPESVIATLPEAMIEADVQLVNVVISLPNMTLNCAEMAAIMFDVDEPIIALATASGPTVAELDEIIAQLFPPTSTPKELITAVRTPSAVDPPEPAMSDVSPDATSVAAKRTT
jgi:hypothetical protein